jgi:hypothetical protein
VSRTERRIISHVGGEAAPKRGYLPGSTLHAAQGCPRCVASAYSGSNSNVTQLMCYSQVIQYLDIYETSVVNPSEQQPVGWFASRLLLWALLADPIDRDLVSLIACIPVGSQ